MLNQPMSSPMMKTMLGFFAGEACVAVAVVGSASARASSVFLAIPSEQDERSSGAGPVWLFGAAIPRAALEASSARDQELKSLVAAMKPSIVPSPTHASD